jgi:hypothetical protein
MLYDNPAFIYKKRRIDVLIKELKAPGLICAD